MRLSTQKLIYQILIAVTAIVFLASLGVLCATSAIDSYDSPIIAGCFLAVSFLTLAITACIPKPWNEPKKDSKYVASEAQRYV